MRGSLARVLAFVLILSSSGFAQELPFFDSAYLVAYATSMQQAYPYSRDFNGGGARAKGMGNAFIGVSDDINAVSWNPAGLDRREDPYEQPVMALGYKSFSGDARFSSRPWDFQDPHEFDYSETYSGWDQMSLLWPMRVKGHSFVAAISYTRLGDELYNTGMALDVGIPFDRDDTLSNTLRPFHYHNVASYHSYTNALNVGFGTRVYDKLSFGLSVNIYGGRAEHNNFETITWEDLIVPDAPSQQRGEGVIVNSVYDTAAFAGAYFTLGFKYNGDKLSAGLVIKTPHTLEETIDVFVNPVAYVNGVVEDGFGQAVHVDDNVVELDQPLIVGLGLGFKATEALMFAADVEFRGYSGGKVSRRDSLSLVPGGTDIEYFTEYDPMWNDTWVFRVGSEYVWETGNHLFPIVPVRAGFSYVPIPEPDVSARDDYWTPISTSTASFTRWSVGAGLRWSQIHLDFAYLSSNLDQEDTSRLDRVSSSDNSSLNFTFTGFF